MQHRATAEDAKLAGARDTSAHYSWFRDGQLETTQELLRAAELCTQQTVAALKARADVLEQILKVGMDLGMIDKAPKHVNVDVSYRNMSLDEIRVRIREERAKIEEMLEDPCDKEPIGVAAAVMRNLTRKLPPESGV